MGIKCSVELAPEAITFETDTTLNKKRAAIKVIYSVVVQPRGPRSPNMTMVRKKNVLPLSPRRSSETTTTAKTSLNSMEATKKVRIGKPGLNVSYSWSDRRTARKEKESKKSHHHKKKHRKRRRRRRRRKRSLTPKDSSSSSSGKDSKSRGKKWKKMITPRRRKRKKKKKQSSAKTKKRPPLPLYAPTTAAGIDDKEIFPKNRHPIKIQFTEDFPASANLCVIFNSNTATYKFHGNGNVPFRTTGGQRRIHRASNCSCFEFSNQISNQKQHYNHCFSVEFQTEDVRYVTHFQEVNRVVLLWAKEIHGLYHEADVGDDNIHQILMNVPVLLCLPQNSYGGGGTATKKQMETMDLIICDAKSTAWLKRRHVQLFPVRQIKAADIQAYMNQAQRNNEDSQSSCSDAASLTRKKKKQAQRNRSHKKKKKRNRSRFWFRSRSIQEEEEEIKTPGASKTDELSSSSSSPFKPPPALDLATLRRVTRAVHPDRKGMSSVETSPRGPFTLTDSNYSMSSSPSPSISSTTTTTNSSISQPSSPSGETVVESFSMTTNTATSRSEYTSDASSWFSDSQQGEEQDIIEEEEDVESSSYIQLPEDSTDRIISDSIETASSISETSSTSSWNKRHPRRRRGHHRHNNNNNKKKKKIQSTIPGLNLHPLPTIPTPQRESLLENIAQRMKTEIQITENPQKLSPRFPTHLLSLSLNTVKTSQESSTNDGYNALLSPRSEISPRLCKQHREDIMKQAQQKKDGASDSDIASSLKKDIDKQVKQKQREHLVDLLNKKKEKQLQKSPREKIKKLGRVLSHRRLPTTTTTKNRELYKKLNRQNSLRNNPFSLPHSLYASTGSLPTQAVKTGTTKRSLKKDSYQ